MPPSTHIPPHRADPWTRLCQIFLAKIVLEVFGGGGAIWGFSEVVTFRNPDTLWFWRPCAATIGALFFIRWLLQIKDFVNQYVLLRQEPGDVFNWTRFFQIFTAKIVLEVFGGGGAVWGFSESLTLRNPETQEFWRFWAATTGAIFFVRYILQMVDYTKHREIDNQARPWLRCVQIFSAKMVLEVWGGAGAIWGFSEVLTLRNPHTLWFWRPVALTIGFIFFCRWILQVIDYCCEVKGFDSTLQMAYEKAVRMYQIFSARLVLEVFGGGGAIWGFSEALTLRNPDTLWFWRPAALIIGGIFFIRWILQMLDYVLEAKFGEPGYNLHRDQWVRLLQVFSARLVLEVFGGAGAIWGFSEALTLRTPETLWFWRPTALLVGAIFFYRWLLQIKDFILDMKDSDFDDVYKEAIRESEKAANKDEEKKEDETTELLLSVEYGTTT